MSISYLQFDDFSLLDYNKYKNLNITIEKRHTKNPYFIKNNVNPELKKNFKNSLSYKPDGIWFSCGVDWFNWCMLNMPKWVLNKKIYNLLLDNSKIIHIKNMKDLRKFNKEYGIKYYYYDSYSLSDIKKEKSIKKEKKKKRKTRKKRNFYTLINWGEVSKKYSGIKCCPYFREILYNDKNYNYDNQYLWYIMLDAASGCIWDTDCIKKIEVGGYLNKYNGNDKKIKSKFKKIIDKFI